jgi:hypothetical protein
MSTLYVLKEGQKTGPFTTEELEGKVVAGELSHEDLFWMEGMEEWQPLATVLQIVHDAPEPEKVAVEVLYDADGAVVTPHAVHLSCGEEIPLVGITKVVVQSEKVKRFKPVAGCIILGVIIICLVLVEIPRTTATHWILWGGVLLLLIFWWIRMLIVALRVPSILVVIGLNDGDERIVQSKAGKADELCGAINLARAEVQPG